MCGRYYVDEETEKAVWELTEKPEKPVRMGDIHPSERATVLNSSDHVLQAEDLIWGFAGYKEGQLLINARAETILERPAFKESVISRRCVVPAKGFYEWSSSKEKYQFEDEKGPLYLAACYNMQGKFVILTTAANDSVMPVHERMPLLIQKEEIESWITDQDCMERILQRVPKELRRFTKYQQMDLFES